MLVLALAAAASAHADASDDRARHVRYHMRRDLDDLRTIERLLVDGKLAEAQSLTYFFTKPKAPAHRDVPENRDIVLAASSLASARSVDEALRHEVRIAAACAACHQRERVVPAFRAPANPPEHRPTLSSQMAWHQWAVDRMWEAIVGPSDEHWRVALDGIATMRIPSHVRPSPVHLGARLQRQARDALGHDPPLTLAQRTEVFGDLLVTCARCHAAQRADVDTHR
jgi:cytochrome c553